MAIFKFDPTSAVVELRPHKGFTKTVLGLQEVVLPQKIIYVNNKRVGYVGDKKGAPIQLITQGLPAPAIDWLKGKVDEIKGDVSVDIQQASTPAENDVYIDKSQPVEQVSSEDF